MSGISLFGQIRLWCVFRKRLLLSILCSYCVHTVLNALSGPGSLKLGESCAPQLMKHFAFTPNNVGNPTLRRGLNGGPGC